MLIARKNVDEENDVYRDDSQYPIHASFYRIADMLGTASADKRVNSLVCLVDDKFTIDQIKDFSSYWISTQSKFPVLSDLYIYFSMPFSKAKECDHKEVMPIGHSQWQNEWYRNQGMAYLKAYCEMIREHRHVNNGTRFCCYYTNNMTRFYNLADAHRFEYENTTIEQLNDAYRKTLKYLRGIK